MGPERKSRIIPKKDREVVAIHESGHAILALLLTWSTNPLQKVSIIPRGPHALGYTFHPPAEDQYLHTEDEMLGEITVALGGRVAEETMFGRITSGAYGDFQQATKQAEHMVCRLGMSKKLGTVILEDKQFLSQQTIAHIDEEVKRIVDTCYSRATELLQMHKDKILLLARTLLEREVIDGQEVKDLLGLQEITKQPPSII
jgi:cell division protease FtsH